MTDTTIGSTLHGEDAMAVSFLSRAANAIVQASELAKEVAALRSEVEHLQEAVSTLQQQRDNAFDRIEQLVAERNAARDEVTVVRGENTRLQSDFDRATWERDVNWSDLNTARDEISHLRDIGDSAQQLADYRQGEINRLQAANDLLTDECETLRDQVSNRDEELEVAQLELAEVIAGKMAAQSALTEARARLERIAIALGMTAIEVVQPAEELPYAGVQSEGSAQPEVVSAEAEPDWRTERDQTEPVKSDNPSWL